jgi:hypothetical protein
MDIAVLSSLLEHGNAEVVSGGTILNVCSLVM